MSEPFELCDEASGLAFGVAAGEVVAPEVVLTVRALVAVGVGYRLCGALVAHAPGTR